MSPVFAHGQLRLYLLALLADGPRHGYDLIRDLEHTFNGLYSPSAGTVYPRLAKLEEDGLIERLEEGRKSPYRLTNAGQAEVAERRSEIEDIRHDIDHTVSDLAAQVRARVTSDAANLRAELKEAARAARASATTVNVGASERRRPDPGTLSELEATINDFRHEARSAWRRSSINAAQASEIVTILRDAASRIRQVVEKP